MISGKSLCLFAVCITLQFSSIAQAPKKYNAAEIHQKLQHLNVLASALYIAAHPDDENTRLITYLSKEIGAHTAYLSATRGDGGQNLIGAEMGAYLGVIRTQELLQARKIDGGTQFFTRATDFGFSKSAEETFTIWDKEAVLADMVWTIRKFKPDVMITRFSSEPGGTHGHHTASAILAEEAFAAAGDPDRFPEQLQYTTTWSPSQLFWNTSWWFYGSEEKFDAAGLITLDMGAYNAPLGKSYTEIAAESRSMHKSQGFGSAGSRGKELEYLKPIKGKQTEHLFQGVNTSWSRIEGGKEVGKWLLAAANNFDIKNPSHSVPNLIKGYKALQKLPDSHWKHVKEKELKEVIAACLGLYFEAVASSPTVARGDVVTIAFEAINRSNQKVDLIDVKLPLHGKDTFLNVALPNNFDFKIKQKFTIPSDYPISQPYWLREEGSLGMFAVADPLLIGLAESPPAVKVQWQMKVADVPLTFERSLVYKKTDPVDGEIYRPFTVIPPVTLNLKEPIYMFTDQQPKALEVTVRAGKANASGTANIRTPDGWRVEPKAVDFSLKVPGEEVKYIFQLFPPAVSSEGEIALEAQIDGEMVSKSYKEIDYSHIPPQLLFAEASARVVKLDLQKKGSKIGYIMGAGDDIPAALEQIGYRVTLLQDDELSLQGLKNFDAVLVGVRAYNVREKLQFQQQQLLQYVEDGGTLIVQYNTSAGLVTDQLGPYPLKLGRDRVTVENAEVRFINPEHLLLNKPNKITPEDFENWVQERGLYFPASWSDQYETVISSNDPGEKALDGGILVTKFGKGNYIYSSYSWFRELPAGVPGAYRLLVNMISIGK